MPYENVTNAAEISLTLQESWNPDVQRGVADAIINAIRNQNPEKPLIDESSLVATCLDLMAAGDLFLSSFDI